MSFDVACESKEMLLEINPFFLLLVATFYSEELLFPNGLHADC
jgi:hypothetical protein